VDALDLILHPVRLRILHAMSGGRVRTTSDLCADLPDVPKTSLYRNVGMLAEAGALEVVGEQRVHGAVERRYRLRREGATVDAGTAASMSLEDHRHGFAAAVAALIAEFNAYLDREDANPAADFVSYRQGPVWLSREELAELVEEVRRAIVSRWGNEPRPGRRPHLLATILFPLAHGPSDLEVDRHPGAPEGDRSPAGAPSDGQLTS
jgi:DNA-binding transcriptional ArsR family regulator